MSDLVRIQDKFQDYLLNANDDITQEVVGTEKVSVETRLSIYHYAYHSRLLEALASNYPILQIYMGEEAFAQLGSAYLNQFPSTYRSIRWFGDQLSLFLKEHDEYQYYPYLAELALIEWTMTLVFDAADAQVFSLEAITEIPPDSWVNMRLMPHPSVHLLQLTWNVIPIWQALTEEQTLPDLIQSQAVNWIFWRDESINRFCSLPEDEAWAINAMLTGSTFGDICEGLCKWVDENAAAMHAASLLKGWISGHLISTIIF